MNIIFIFCLYIYTIYTCIKDTLILVSNKISFYSCVNNFLSLKFVKYYGDHN